MLFSLFCLSVSWHVNADYEVITHEVADDQWVQVDLPFDFPFYGQVFGTSFMFTNGVVGFINPTEIAGTGIVNDGLCCNAYDFTATGNNYGTHGAVRFNYLIAPWHTDLIDHPTSDGVMMTQGGCDTVESCYQSYFWENISEYYDNTDLNTFSTTIEPLGSILFNYTKVDIQSHSVSVFVSGDFSNSDEYEQWYYNHPTNGGVYWNSADTEPIEIPETLSICEIAPDASLTCLYRPSTWAGAYYDQQCGLDSLYDSGCDGYAEAYLLQQCTISVLYNSACDGYATAYYDQQCGLDGLYDTGCSNYETAYFDNQCELDPLYSPACAGWYYVEEEETETEEYGGQEEEYEETAVFEPETTYSESTGFDISIDFDLSDALVSTFEPEFQEYDVSFDDIMLEFEQEIEQEMETLFAEVEIEEEVLDEPIEEVVEETVEEPETEPEPLEEEPIEEETLDEETDEQEEEEAEEDEGTEDEEVVEESEMEEVEEPEPEEKEEVMVAKTEPKEMTADDKKKARQKKMREIITDKLKNLAVEMGEASSLEVQKQLQNIILALLNYNQGFSSYNLSLADGNFYESRVIYDIRIPDSLRGRRIGLASELLHKQLVDIQWDDGYGRKTD